MARIVQNPRRVAEAEFLPSLVGHSTRWHATVAGITRQLARHARLRNTAAMPRRIIALNRRVESGLVSHIRPDRSQEQE